MPAVQELECKCLAKSTLYDRLTQYQRAPSLRDPEQLCVDC